jgi:hypothetical protein
MKTIPQKDIIRRADGTTVPTTVVTDGSTVGERKFSLSGTTDRMGITNAGSVAKGFIWGLIIGAGIVMGIGLYANKISFNYSK